MGIARIIISVYRNPGFYPDWFLMGTTTSHKAALIQADIRSYTGRQEMLVHKKETGGNIIQVFFKGFSPKQQR